MQSMRGKDRKYLAEGGEAYHEDGPVLNPHKTKKFMDAFSSTYAEGGDVDDDMIHAIMKKRGNTDGAMANEDGPIADSEEAEYDDMVLDDNMGHKADYTGENSGDYDGDMQEDEDRHDIVKSIMKSRRLKDKMPRPA